MKTKEVSTHLGFTASATLQFSKASIYQGLGNSYLRTNFEVVHTRALLCCYPVLNPLFNFETENYF